MTYAMRMIAQIYSAIPDGYNDQIVNVEGDTNRGLPSFNIVGMPNKTITEAKERVRSAIMNSDLIFPARKVTINLAPAELAKDGTHLDLPIALAILTLSKQIKQKDTLDSLFVGELSLSGETRPVRGIINIVETARAAGYQKVYLPIDNLPQANLVSDIQLFGVRNLRELMLHLNHVEDIYPNMNKIFPNLHNSGTQNDSTPIVQNNCTEVNNIIDQSVVKNTRMEYSSNRTKTKTKPQKKLNNVVENTITDTKIHKSSRSESVVKNTNTETDSYFLDQIIGHSLAKRALAIAIAGHHNILLYGPPGSGKTLLAKTAANLLPSPTPDEQIAITKIHSLSSPGNQVISARPFRAPHHTASSSAIIGGGNHVTPGEISLAHHGILFLDELPEFSRNVLESLRQPLESGTINISRANRRVTYPAKFMLIATMNPCPCGFYGDAKHQCKCSYNQIQNYRQKISGPILDRIDIILCVNSIPQSEILENLTNNETSTHPEHNVVKNNIKEAIDHQFQRYGQEEYNSYLSSAQIQNYIHLDEDTKKFCLSAMDKLNLSTRGYYKVLRVARTIADLESSPEITTAHLAEALTFRQCF